MKEYLARKREYVFLIFFQHGAPSQAPASMKA